MSKLLLYLDPYYYYYLFYSTIAASFPLLCLFMLTQNRDKSFITRCVMSHRTGCCPCRRTSLLAMNAPEGELVSGQDSARAGGDKARAEDSLQEQLRMVLFHAEECFDRYILCEAL